MAEPDFFLDAYAARSCPVKTHNAYDQAPPAPAGPVEPLEPSEALREQFAGGEDFADRVLATLAALPGTVDLRPLADAPVSDRLAACERAMATGAPIVLGGLVRRDAAGHRSGVPKAWLRGANQGDGRPGYHPLLVKRHKVAERRGQSRASRRQLGALLRVAPLTGPGFSQAVEQVNWSFRPHRQDDLLEACHHWRLLRAAGWASPTTPRAALVGTDTYPDPDEGRAADEVPVFWVELSVPFLRTFSRTADSGWVLRSPLDRYDHEFGFRVDVARAALRRTGGADDPTPMVRPIRVPECDRCQWWERCRPQLHDEDLSLRIDATPLDVREIRALRRLGVETLTDLLTVDLDQLLPAYLPEVTHRAGAERRVRLAARRAGMLSSGVTLDRSTAGPIEIPEAEIEVDFDIENSREDHVYLWGFLVHDRSSDQPPHYVEFSDWGPMEGAGEAALAVRAMSWLRGLVLSGRSVRVFHYSDHETRYLQQLAQRSGAPDLVWATEWAGRGFVDLLEAVRQHYVGTRGLGLKVVATEGPGFRWRDEDPGGLNSQTWYEEAVHGPTTEVRSAARERVLAYNEDDVVATWHVRRWLRAQS